MKEFNIKLLAADRVLYEGPCVSLTVPLPDGQMGVMANHVNAVTAISPGVLKYRVSETSEPVRAAVSSGIMKVENNTVLVLVDTAEPADQIDQARAEAALKRAREELSHYESKKQHTAASMDLERAIGRLNAKRRRG